MKRRLLLLGATGLTGQQLLAKALDQGHEVTALVRRPGKLETEHRSLHVIEGDATDPTAVDAATVAQDAVICALGERSPRAIIHSTLMSTSMRALVPAMQRHGVERLIIESALGVGPSAAHAPPRFRLAFATVLRQVGKDKAAAENYVRSSGVDWTIVYPPKLTSGPATDTYRHGESPELSGLPRISRADVAHFMLHQLNEPTYSRRAAVITS